MRWVQKGQGRDFITGVGWAGLISRWDDINDTKGHWMRTKGQADRGLGAFNNVRNVGEGHHPSQEHWDEH